MEHEYKGSDSNHEVVLDSYNLFIENYTSYHMCQKLLHKIRELKNG